MPGSALLSGKVGEKWKFEKKICGTVRRNMLLFLPQVQTKMNKDYAEMADRNWNNHDKRLEAQNKGRSSWYKHYRVRTAQLEREYEFEREKK